MISISPDEAMYAPATTQTAVKPKIEHVASAGGPMALGVLYDDPRPTFEAAAMAEKAAASEGKEANLAKLLGKGQTWTVSGTAQDPV